MEESRSRSRLKTRRHKQGDVQPSANLLTTCKDQQAGRRLYESFRLSVTPP